MEWASQPKEGFSQAIAPVALTVEASAAGYKDWYYVRRGSKDHKGVTYLAPKQTKTLVVALRSKFH
jgi:hypothetical protein